MVGADLVRGGDAGARRGRRARGLAAALGRSSSPRSCSRRATSYFAPAYGADDARRRRPDERPAGERARPRDRAGALGRRLGTRGRLLLAFLPVSTFFAVDAATFFVSARADRRACAPDRGRAATAEPPRLREGIAALRPRRALAAAVVVFGVAMTITTGCWIAGVPTLVRDTLDHGRGRLLGRDDRLRGRLDRRRGRAGAGAGPSKARASMLAWSIYLPAYGLLARRGSLPLAVAAAVGTGAGESLSYVLLNSAAQEEVPDDVLGRVLGVISFVHRGSHATGLLLVSPLFAVAAPRPLFGAAAVAVALVGLAGVAVAGRAGRERSRSERGPDATAGQRSSRRSSSTCDGSKPSIRSDRARRRDRGARGHQADELRADHLGAARRRLGGDPRDDLVQRGRLPVLDVHRHLHEPGRGSVEPERPDAREAAAALADDGRDLPRGLERAAQVHVERDQRPPGADEHGAGRRVERARAEVGRELAARRGAAASSSTPPRR